MSKHPRKPYGINTGKPLRALTSFKLCWLKMPEEEKERWRDIIYSRITTTEEVRQKIRDDLKIDLTNDSQIILFRRWDEKECEIEFERQRQVLDHKRLTALHADWSLDQIRKEVLRLSYERTLSEGDYTQALATIRESVRADRLALDTRIVELREKKTAQAEAEKEADNKPQMTREEREQRIREIYQSI